MMIVFKIIFLGILFIMVMVMVWVSLYENMMKMFVFVMGDFWFIVIMFDVYFGFMIFFIWVCYKEKLMVVSVLWFVLIMFLGNMVMVSYVLFKLCKLGK